MAGKVLQQGQPYMIRNDGKVFACPKLHPYIIDQPEDDLDYNLFQLFIEYPLQLKWFYQHTSEQSTKDLITSVSQQVVNILYNADQWNTFDSQIEFFKGTRLEDVLRAVSFLSIEPQVLEDGVTDEILTQFYEDYDLLNAETNQEFLRARLGGQYVRDSLNDTLYFRVSSVEFNWFNIIYKIAADNRFQSSKVTICIDNQSGKEPPSNSTYKDLDWYYVLSGEIIKEYPIDDFLTLKGNPVVEELALSSAKALRLGRSIVGSKCSLNEYYHLKSTYIKLNFKKAAKE